MLLRMPEWVSDQGWAQVFSAFWLPSGCGPRGDTRPRLRERTCERIRRLATAEKLNPASALDEWKALVPVAEKYYNAGQLMPEALFTPSSRPAARPRARPHHTWPPARPITCPPSLAPRTLVGFTLNRLGPPPSGTTQRSTWHDKSSGSISLARTAQATLSGA